MMFAAVLKVVEMNVMSDVRHMYLVLSDSISYNISVIYHIILMS